MDAKKDVFEMILEHVGDDSTGKAQAVESTVTPGPDWDAFGSEGQLAVDVLESDEEVFVVSTMAGADTKHIEVYIHSDLLTIRGQRVSPVDEIQNAAYIHNECFWGPFSRTIVLPVDVKADVAQADYKGGILTVRIPKQKTNAKITVVIEEE